MDKELLAAIGSILQEQLEPIKQDITGLKQDMTSVKQDMAGLDQKFSGLEKQNDIIAGYVIKILDEVKIIKDIKGSLFNVESEVRELHKGQQRIETRLDRVEGDVKVIGEMYGDHETQISELRRKVASS